MTIKRISSGSTFERDIGYARCVLDDDYLHIAGTTGYDYGTMTLPETAVAQAEQCMRNLAVALATDGLDFSDVVRVRYLFPDRNDFEPCWPIFRASFGAHPPAATMLVAQLYEPAMKLEIEVTARRRT